MKIPVDIKSGFVASVKALILPAFLPSNFEASRYKSTIPRIPIGGLVKVYEYLLTPKKIKNKDVINSFAGGWIEVQF